MPSYLSYKRQMAVLDADDDIQWITVKGNHIPIKKGESKEDAINKFFESKGAKSTPSKPKESKGGSNKPKAEGSSASGKKPFMTEKEYAAVKKNVEHILKKAVESEPKITKDLKSIEGIKLLGLDYRLKTEKSAVEKVKRERIEKGEKIAKFTDEDIMSGMWDLVRYTQEVDKDTFVEQAEKTLKTLEKKGYKVFELKNFWLPEYNGNGSNPYRGVNVKLLSPDGQKVELQFNTANNMKVKEDMHQIYNQQREYKPDSKEFKELNEKSLKLTKLFDNPKGIERLVRKKATN